MAFFDLFASNPKEPNIDLSDFKFISDDHTRHENEQAVKADNKGCMRGIRVQRNISSNKGYTVTIYNLDGNHSLWGNNIQMSPKQMEITSNSNAGIEFRGFGKDVMGNNFSDYGIIIHLLNDLPTKITLKMYDRKIYIVYKKYEPSTYTAESLDIEIAANQLVQQHFGHYLATNQAITVDDLEADIANLISYIRLYNNNPSALKLSFLDKKLLDFIRDNKFNFPSAIISEAMELYPEHFDTGNAVSCMQIEVSNSSKYKEEELAGFLKNEYQNRHLHKF